MTVQPERRTSRVSEQPDGGVRRQALFRALNEHIERISDGFGVEEQLDFICECEHGECFERITISRADYEVIRRFPTHFLVKPAHAGADERIVDKTAAYAVIEKIGSGAENAIVLDPRKPGRSEPTP